MDDAAISTLPGIGPGTQRRLADAGLGTIADLRAVGSVEACRRIRFMSAREVGPNALYDIEAALRGCHRLDLPPSVKTALQQEARTIDEASRKDASSRCVFG
jgi:DNA transformation protein